MKGKLIQTLVLILLVVLNLILLILYLVELRSTRMITQESIDRVVALYEAENLSFEAQIGRTVKSRETISLKAADLDGMVTKYLGSRDYNRTYIYGNKIQYRTETLVLLADWSAHSISYRDSAFEKTEEESPPHKLTAQEQEMLMAAGRRFAQQWLGEEVMLMSMVGTDGVLTMTFCQLQSGELMYFNKVAVTLVPGGVRSAEIQYWDIDSEQTRIESKPVDELLYQMLPEICADLAKSPDRESDTVEELIDGYEIISLSRDTAIACPNLTLVLTSGNYYHLRYTG